MHRLSTVAIAILSLLLAAELPVGRALGEAKAQDV